VLPLQWKIMKKTRYEANSKDYSMSFKLQLVQEIERGLTVKEVAIQNRKLLSNG
jgi:transposase-like protein